MITITPPGHPLFDSLKADPAASGANPFALAVEHPLLLDHGGLASRAGHRGAPGSSPQETKPVPKKELQAADEERHTRHHRVGKRRPEKDHHK